jgi:hypothetical protein
VTSWLGTGKTITFFTVYLLSPLLPAKISLSQQNVNFPPVFLVYSEDLVSLRGRTLRESIDSEKVPFFS